MDKEVIAVLDGFLKHGTLLITFIVGCWAWYKFNKQREINKELQEQKANLDRGLKQYEQRFSISFEVYKGELQKLAEQQRYMNQRRLTDFNLYTTKKHERSIELHEKLFNARNKVLWRNNPLRQLPTFSDYNREDMIDFLEKYNITKGRKEELLNRWEENQRKRIKYRMNFFAMLKNRNKIPWDLFDGTKGAVIPNKPYRYVMNEFLQEIMRMAGESAALAYMVLKSFWEKWYNDFITAMYNVGLSGHPPENISAFYRMIWSLEPKDEKTEFCGSLFSEVLFNLLKEEMKLKLYQFQYILKHSMIKMESLNEEQLKVRPLFMDPKVALCEVSYDEAKKVIRQYWREVQIFLGYDADVSKSFSHAMKLMQLIVEPNKQTVAFWKIITMMQCCATPLNNNFTITRYGMDGGEKNVKLSTIILRPANNDGIETRLYLVHLMRRRYFMNLFDRETVDQIDRYRLALEEGVSNSLDNMGSWDTIRPTLSGIKDAYDEAVAQYAGELGMI